MEHFLSERIFLMLVILQAGFIECQGVTVRFTKENYGTINETKDAFTTLTIEKDGDFGSDFTVIIQVENETSDLTTNSWIVAFLKNDTASVKSFNVFVAEDDVPEENEVVRFTMRSLRAIRIGEPSTAQLTILANDDSNGIIGFETLSPVKVDEESKKNTSVTLSLIRQKGRFGDVSVSYEISGPEGFQNDIFPLQGIVTMSQGEYRKDFDLEVIDDQIPENAEQFQVTLLDAKGGLKIDETSKSVYIVVNGNDSPLRFSEKIYRVEEDAKSLEITVFRGLDKKGVSRIGPDKGSAWVKYAAVPGTATSDLDYHLQSPGTFSFNDQEHRASVKIFILEDDIPELNENFTIHLLADDKYGDVIVAEPSSCTVVIETNDNAKGVLSIDFEKAQDGNDFFVINEDEMTEFSNISVARHGGSFSEVTIQWVLISNALEDKIISDVRPTSGVLVFEPGQVQAEITLTVIQDEIPEEAKSIVFRLLSDSLQGGAIVGEPTEAVVVITDSDDVYGVFSLDDTNSRIEINELQRNLVVGVKRTGGTTGNVNLKYSVHYLPPGVNDIKLSMPGITTTSEGNLLFLQKEVTKKILIGIEENAFLELGSSFFVVLHSVSLIGKTTMIPSRTPRLNLGNLTVNVTEQFANGEIGFRNESPIQVSEPADDENPLDVILELHRQGLSGPALVQVSYRNLGDNALDVVEGLDYLKGPDVVRFQPGERHQKITIQILPDQIPEIEEKILIRLDSVEPSNQKLKTSRSEIQVIIAENDSPGGVFSFSNQMPAHYVIQEKESESVIVVVQRNKGSLASRMITYDVIPDGSQQFYAVPDTLIFPPGMTSATIALVPIDDAIPELDINYTLVIRPEEREGTVRSVLAPPTTVQVTVLANDYPHGLFVFGNDDDTPKVQSIGESKADRNASAFYRVHRTMGTYGNVSVSWKVIPDDTDDVIPTEGILNFSEGDTELILSVQSARDELPETLEEFTLHLLNATGGAMIEQGENATLIIEPNDKAISFNGPSVVTVKEGDYLTLTIHRKGSGADATSVRYRTRVVSLNDSLEQHIATPKDDFEEAVNTKITFRPGVLDVDVKIFIVNDSIPEDDETFFLELFSAQHDYVTFGNDNVEVIISQNDDASGIFYFDASNDVELEEGKPFSVPVRRDKGAFGDVSLHWKILRGVNMTYQTVQENSLNDEKLEEFLQSEGELMFEEGIVTRDLILEALADSKPEYEESFTVTLLNVTSGQASLSLNLSSLMLRIVVKTNDHPYGLMSFANATTPILLAEDGDVGNEFTVEVERDMGSDGNIEVLWEVHPSNSSLPSYCKDLILAGELLGGATYTQGRTYTDTPAVNFAADSSVLIENPKTNFNASNQGFSFSFWIKFNSSFPASIAESTLCKILSEFNVADSTILSLSLKNQALQIGLEIQFRPNLQHVGTLQSLSLSLDFNKMTLWHHLVVSFDDDLVTAYSEGKLVDSKQLDTSLIRTVLSGEHYIILGPDFAFINDIIDYDMQDVRLYNMTLKPNQVNELFTMPTHSDLSPISGYLKYNHNARKANFSLRSTDDLEIENNENFQLILMDTTGGASVNQENGSITVTVLKSDNANGLFGFSQPCHPDHVIEGQPFICFINRSRGYDGDVVVKWKATYNQSEGNDEDFNHFQGEIKFFHGEKEKSFNITTVDDEIPEINEIHSLTLIDATSLDGVPSSTLYSGASIDEHLATTFLSIQPNDKPNGVLQFSDASPPTLEDKGKIPEQPEPLVVHAAEEDNHVTLMVVRAAGWFGQVTSEWRTEDGTAISNQEPRDFESSAGTLSFNDGQGYASLTLTLLDDDVSELEKYFYVELITATGGASFNNASRVKIVIDPSDHAFGVFNFNQSSQRIEEPDVGTSTIRLQVTRSGGLLGETTIDWRIRNNASSDLSPDHGQLYFIEGQTTDDVFLNVLADDAPEFDEDFQIDLVQVSQGALGAIKTCTLTVLANDDPRGVVIFDPTSISAREEDRNVTLTIRRSKGLAGTIRVYYATMDTFVNNSLSEGIAVSGQDFQQVMDSILIDENVTTVNVSINLFDDDIPETNEIFFVELLSTEMVSSGVEVPNSPRLGTGRAIMMEVTIVANDNPHGILELGSSSVKVDEDSDEANATENSQNDKVKGFLNVIRKLGTFGDVTVSFNVIPKSATANEDYNVVRSEVTLLNGESKKIVPIHIVNDITPEIEEDFVVELLHGSVTGGARVGDEDTCRVTISESDDPYGLFELSVDKDRVEEPAGGQSTPVTLTVRRRNGDRSVVSLRWKINIRPALSAAEGGNGQGETSAQLNRDVDSLEGPIYFTTGEMTKHFTIKILSDDIPEDDELVVVRLEEILPGYRGRINPHRNEVQVLVPANDRPYGDVSLENHVYLAHETENDNNFVTVVANRSGGLYGTVRIIYSTSEIDLVTEMLENEEDLIKRYLKPRIVDNIDSASTFQSVDIISSDNPLVTCAEECLRERVCHVFLYQEMSYSCKWTTRDSLERGYITYTSDDVTLTPSQLAGRYSLYEKNSTQMSILYNSQAKSGIDFIPQSGASVLLYPGQQSAFINITIQDDTEPELNEYFKVAILDVKMVNFQPLSSNLPQILSPATTRITIEENDYPYGIFVLRTQGSSSNQNDPIEVEEKEKLSVELLVERKGGSIGDVTVDWSVTGGTASRNNDFIGDDATLKFAHGETIKKISLSIIDDSTPEPSESINIRLSNPTNGAVLDNEQDRSIVMILANDVVGGVIGFKPNSRSVIGQEGESITLHLSRSEPALGRCNVTWHGESVGDNDIMNGLNVTQGVITFESGQVEAQLNIQINSDDTPESKEEYRVVLNQAETSDIASSGAAILNPRSSASEISIQESDDPHGIFRFAPTFQRINIKENDGKLEILISRQFGSIGTVRVYYDIISEILGTINPDIDVATPGSDFTYSLGDSYVTFADGMTSAPVVMEIVDDDIPELMEIFYVNLTYARLIGPNGYDVTPLLPPKIDESDSLSQVVIDANDGTKGEVSFDDSVSHVFTKEGSVVSLRLVRSRGTYGEVTVFIFPQNNQAKVDEDYSCQPMTLALADSQNSALYDITIIDDDIPEGSESFEVSLGSPSPGLELGNLTSITVTIQSNDDAHGRLSFDNDLEITLDEPAGPNITSSKAELYVKRSPPDGVFGQVSVRYKVQQISSTGELVDSHVSDLTPVDGYVVIENGNSFGVIEISVVPDDVAELAERFVVTLYDPENGATLDNIATSTEIIIRENDAPYGEFQVFPTGSRNESRNYRVSEDTDKLLQVDVVRQQGVLGFVTVDLKTTQDTAVSLIPSDSYPPLLAPSQIFPRSVGVWFHSFQSKGINYLVYLAPTLALPLSSPVGSSGSLTSLTPNIYSTLYKWTGVYTPVQSIETDGASCATTFVAEEVHYLFITNSGTDRRRESFSRLYEVTDAGSLLVVQDIPTKGASYVVHFNTTDHYLIIANSMDNNMVSTVDSIVLRFNNITRLLDEVQSLPTRGATGLSVFKLNKDIYLAAANKFDSEIGIDAPVASVVYKWNPTTTSFTQPSTIDYSHAADVQHYDSGEHSFLIFASAGGRQTKIASNVDGDAVKVYQVMQNDRHGSILLRSHQLLNVTRPRRIEVFTSTIDMLNARGRVSSSFLKNNELTMLMVSSDVSSRIFIFNYSSSLFIPLFDAMPSVHIYPHKMLDSFHSTVVVAVAVDDTSLQTHVLFDSSIHHALDYTHFTTSGIYDICNLHAGSFSYSKHRPEGDYIETTKTLTFEPGQTVHTVAITILNDDISEKDEIFQITLSNQNDDRAVVNDITSNLNVIIEANDDAFGVIGFSEDSTEKSVKETASDNAFTLNVVRHSATFGKVVVDWSAEGSINDITPVSGQIMFEEGQSVVGIQLAVLADDFPEVEEIVEILLLNARVVGYISSHVQPRLNMTTSRSRVRILANDSPHGVVSWASNSLHQVVSEAQTLQGVSSLITLDLIREQGAMGDIEVHFKTALAKNLPLRSQAIPDVDFISRDASLVMKENSTRAAASFSILPDEIPEDKESFYIIIDDVTLIGESEIEGLPGIGTDGNDVAEVTIDENDNARGFLQFNVTRNEEGAVDAFELPRTNNSVKLPLMRLVGFVHSVGAEWIARPVTAMNTDFFPSSGSVEFLDGENSSEIKIFITDDEEVEFMESFTVQLVATTGGAQLGGDLTVTVNILPNDSPSGMFGFLEESQTVKESTSSNDPRGVVVYHVKRFQGSNEDVTLLWKLEESAHADVSPVSGKLEFDAGIRSKSITLRTLPDNEIEGEEIYDLRLISVTGGAEISPIAGVAKVVIAANPGAAGVVSLETNTLFISEPENGADGVFKVGVRRASSIFGRVTVDWQIIPADQNAFKRVQGQVVFEDRQNETAIYLQTVDDDIPEHAKEYVLRVVAISGGAELSSGESSCLLTVVASDNPHGVFTFLQPIYHVKEGKHDQYAVPASSETPSLSSSYASVRLLRNKGAMSEVAVRIATSPGSALQNVDYYPISKTIIFTEGEAMKVIDIEIIDDSLPEGPKEFFINMTDIELLSFDKSDFVIHSPFNLSRDIFPTYGDITWSVVRIAKSDGAEGLVEFAYADGSMKVREEAGKVNVALIRRDGDYGSISVTVNSLNRTAKRNVDFLMPSSGIDVPFEDGQTKAYAAILLVDDSLMEHDETFTLALTTVSGGARIGDNKFLEVTILKSDYPNGVIRFVDENNVVVPNPPTTSLGRRLKFTFERFGGNQEAISVKWRVSRAEPLIAPTTFASPLDEDISSPTNGVYNFEDGQGGRRDILVNILPTNDLQEVEEHFIISIEDPSPAEVSKEMGNATITVLKKGHPNGVVKFGRSNEQNQPIQTLETDEPLSGTTQLVFPIMRFLGSLGQLNVSWSLSGISEDFSANSDDVTAMTGFVLIYDGQFDAEILVSVIADDLPELDETFVLTLLSVDGGAEIDRRNANRPFMIRANDNPHGVFQLETENQQITVEPDMKRLLRVNVTRDQGAFGRAVVGFSVQFNKPQPGMSYVTTNSGTAVFANATKWATEAIEISSSVFLQAGDSFTVKLITVEFIGSAMRIEPTISSSKSSINVEVTEEVANSRVGFNNLVAHVHSVTTNLCTLNIKREGLFGDVTVYWSSGYFPEYAPPDVDQERLLPPSGEAILKNMKKSINFNVTLLPSTSIRPGYAVHITRLQSTIGGGAKKISDHDVVEIDPCGAIRLVPSSQRVIVGQNTPEVNLTVERLYGVRYDVEVDFVVLPVSASPNVHYVTPLSNKIIIPNGEKRKTIVIELIQTSLQRSKIFRVNLTSTHQSQNIYQGSSPRLIPGQHSSHVIISESPDARGVFSFRDAIIHTAENNNDGSGVSILLVDVERTAGTTGDVSVVTSTFENKILLNGFNVSPTSGGSANQDIRRKVLQMATEEKTKQATSGVDYEMHEFNITFPDGVERRSVAIVILDDAVAEPAESFFVYLHSPTGGAKVSADGGVTKIIIDPNDIPNGVVGFVPEAYFIDEDTNRKANIKMSRTNAFGDVTIDWRALSSLPPNNRLPLKHNSGTRNPNKVLTTPSKSKIILQEQLQTTRGSVTCPAHQRECFVELTLKDDMVAEFAATFYLEIYQVSDGAKIDEDNKFANVTIKDSDSPFGLFQFSASSRFPVVTKDSKSVGLTIERQGGIDTSASVRYVTRQLRRATTIAGATLYPAETGVDFITKNEDVTFKRGEREAYVTVQLKPKTTSANPLPLLFQVVLDWSSGNSQLSTAYYVANVTIARDATVKRVWRVYETLQQDLDETVMQEVLSQLSDLADDDLDNEKIKIFHACLDHIIEEGRKRRLSNALLEKTYQLFCKLLSPARDDAVRGHADFSESFDQFALCLTTQSECVTSDVTTTVMTSCKHAMIQSSRWYPELINGYVFNGAGKDFFQVPKDLLDVARHGADSQHPRCFDIYFIEYSAASWFEVEGEKSPMSNKVFSVGVDKEGIASLSTPVRYRVYTTDARISPQQAECVLWRQASSRWLSTSHGTCHVIDDTSNFVECACNHMSVYAARGPTDNLANYNEATYAACFISMFGFLVTLLSHHLCTRRSKMALKLLMHMCFACAATQLVFAIGALKSSDVTKDSCSALAIFLHYFWLAQFTWMFIQSINILQVLSFSNENTERRLSVFFIFGWGIPAVVILLYVIVMYALGNASLHDSYGDVHNNGVMCTIMSPNGALLSAIVPASVCILIVVTIAVHLYQKEGEWKRFDDVYYGKFNSTEVPLVYWLFFFMSITWLWGGLHLAYGQMWMHILFVVCNFLQGFYVLVTYGILHSPALNKTKDLYDGNLNKPEHMTHENPAYETAVLDGVASVAGDIMNRSTQSLMKFDGIWESIENSVDDDDNAIDCNDGTSADFEDLMSALKEEETLDAAHLDETKPQVAELNVQQYMTSSMMSPDPALSSGTKAAASFQPDRKLFSLSDTHL